MLMRDTTTPGTSASSISWSTRANVIVNSYCEKVMFAKFAYDPAICSGSMWMLSWRSWPSSFTPSYDTADGVLQLPALRVRDERASPRAPRRHHRLHPDARRKLGGRLLPVCGDRHAPRNRHEAEHDLREVPDHRPADRGRGNLRLYRDDTRGADRPRRGHRRVGRAEKEKGDRPAGGPLHHLRLRPSRPAGGRRIPARGRAVRRPRLQRDGDYD